MPTQNLIRLVRLARSHCLANPDAQRNNCEEIHKPILTYHEYHLPDISENLPQPARMELSVATPAANAAAGPVFDPEIDLRLR